MKELRNNAPPPPPDGPNNRNRGEYSVLIKTVNEFVTRFTLGY